MVHDLSPFLWRISGEFGIRWYGLAYMTGFVLSYYLLIWMAKRQKYELQPAQVGDLVTFGAIGILAGGRLGYCVFYSPELFLQFKSSFPFWGVFAVNEGGMSSHGGMIGLVIACFVFGIKYGVSRLHLFDLVSLCGPVGIFFGRIANFINGELVGRPVDSQFPLAVKFPSDIILWPSHEISKLPGLSTVVEKIPGLSSDKWLEMSAKYSLDSEARDYIQNGIYQIIDAIQSGNAAAKEAIAPLLISRHPSQLYAAFGEGILLFLVLFIFWYKPRKPGVVGALFLVFYAFVRISDEFFRMPDVQIGYELFGLTRGQWLSTVMILVGLILAWLWNRHGSITVPGWGRGQNISIGRRK